MTENSRTALQVALNEKIQRRQQLNEMADQYELRAKIIREEEIPMFDKEIRDIQADLE